MTGRGGGWGHFREQRRGAGLHPRNARGAVENRRIGDGLPGGACQSLFSSATVHEKGLSRCAGWPPQRRPWQNLRANSCGRGRENGAIWPDPFARDARRTPPNKCAGSALTHRSGASIVEGLWIHADEGGPTNARSRDAATVQGVVVVIPRFEARLAAHRDCADEQHEGCQGTPRARHGNVPQMRHCQRRLLTSLSTMQPRRRN